MPQRQGPPEARPPADLPGGLQLPRLRQGARGALLLVGQAGRGWSHGLVRPGREAAQRLSRGEEVRAGEHRGHEHPRAHVRRAHALHRAAGRRSGLRERLRRSPASSRRGRLPSPSASAPAPGRHRLAQLVHAHGHPPSHGGHLPGRPGGHGHCQAVHRLCHRAGKACQDWGGEHLHAFLSGSLLAFVRRVLRAGPRRLRHLPRT